MKMLLRRATLLSCALLSLAAVPGQVLGQTLPTPRQWVDNLDLRCYDIPNQPPLGQMLRLDHLNPVLTGMRLPFETVTLGSPEDLCVPVSKNSTPPPANVLPFIEWLDWKCYGISGPSINVPLTLTQLNPIISSLLGPTLPVTVLQPVQLCVPVLKSTSLPPTQPPPAVLNLVANVDVKCYDVESSANHLVSLSLTHLNPLLTHLPPEQVTIGPAPVRLCVPVEKNQTPPPSSVLPLVQFSDVLCYPVDGAALNMNLWLTHINPVLVGLHLPAENVEVTSPDTLCVPVAKNGVIPPGNP
jgi:hypothetical protein